MEIITHFGLSPGYNYLLCLSSVYGAVGVAMAIDFAAGIRRAKKLGRARRSRSYRMTCDKARKYFTPMLVLTCVDLIASIVTLVPIFTMAMGAFNVFCEWKSVMETTYDKDEIRRAASTMSLIIENKDDLARSFAEILKKGLDKPEGGEE